MELEKMARAKAHIEEAKHQLWVLQRALSKLQDSARILRELNARTECLYSQSETMWHSMYVLEKCAEAAESVIKTD
jgi:hypothetical protein